MIYKIFKKGLKKQFILLLLIIILIGCKKSISKENNNKLEQKTEGVYQISNDTLQVSIKSFGAELTSIQHNSREYIWQGNPDFWKHQSPTLFPIVGRLVNHEYQLNGKTYKMNFHGFAWKRNFKLTEKTKKSITLELSSTKKIKKQYPYNFILKIKYTVKGNKLVVNYNVINPSIEEELFFSIGGHPAFNIPLEEGQKRNDYQLVFDTDAMPKSRNKDGGLFIDSYTQFFEEPGILKIQDTTFNSGALVFNPNPFSKTSLVYKPTNNKFFTLDFKDFPYLGIWSANKPNAPFVCVEPWYGVAESIHHNQEFTSKEGIQKLKPKQEFNATYSIIIH